MHTPVSKKVVILSFQTDRFYSSNQQPSRLREVTQSAAGNMLELAQTLFEGAEVSARGLLNRRANNVLPWRRMMSSRSADYFTLNASCNYINRYTSLQRALRWTYISFVRLVGESVRLTCGFV